MKKAWTALLLVVILLFFSLAAAADEDGGVNWTKEERAKIRVGNPTALRGCFFTSLWGGTTSDLDVQNLLHAYSPVIYDVDRSQYRFDRSVVEDTAAYQDAQGRRTYVLALAGDLLWSDGTPITAYDYAFSILFSMDPVINETGGKATNYSWIDGAEEYLDGIAETLSGLRIISDRILQVRTRPGETSYFYELSRLAVRPYPISVIDPGNSVEDNGNGVCLTRPLTTDRIQQYVLNRETGYLSHPKKVSGPYTLTSFDGKTATFRVNPYFKGTEDGILPRIGEIEYTLANNWEMIDQLYSGKFDLLNKVTLSDSIVAGIQGQAGNDAFAMDNYARTGLTLLWFMESSVPVQDDAVRQAFAYCFNRTQFTKIYAGAFGIRMDAYCGLGQWMFRLTSGLIKAPVDETLPEEEYLTAVQKYETITLDGLTVYEVDTDKAAKLLDKAGWVIGEDGIRHREQDGKDVKLSLILGMPASLEAETALEQTLASNLEKVGIKLTMRFMSMEQIQEASEGRLEGPDVLYLGENFSILFDPATLAPQRNEANGGQLTKAKAEVYALAQEMVRTEPDDLYGFMRKWTAMQVRISETLPLLPVYSNVYFDFFTRQLHDYCITETVTWGEAIVKSYMSDAEILPEEEHHNLAETLTLVKQKFIKPSEEKRQDMKK